MTTTPDAIEELIADELTTERLRKLDEVRTAGVDPYPAHVDRTHTAAEAHALFQTLEAEAADESPVVAVAGRLLSIRPHGKLTFATIQDGSGQIQLVFKRDTVGADRYAFFQQTFDRADFVSARGSLFRTRMGELTVEVREFAMLAKALRPLPEKWHGLQDTEARYRQRYLDILTNPDSREVFLRRTAIVSAMR
ncbi:MAG: OB-fold nucleic acid binding domain-containing protein, partial [Anaerolineae bacterium]